MSKPNDSVNDNNHLLHNSTLKSYLTGFVLSLILSGISFTLVTNSLLPKFATVIVILLLATTQLVVQLVYFMHIGSEDKPRWNFLTLLFTIVILFIVVGGSLWIMYALNYNMVH